jgi:hypothetical protein
MHYVEIEYHNHITGNIQQIKSQLSRVTQSIPQGSVLGCILFLIYINDLPKSINCSCTLFADDISLVFPCDNNITLKNQLDKTISSIVTWLQDHNLKINFSKTKLIEFRPYQKRSLNINYSFEKTNLECVNTAPLLGIHIDSYINWKEHVHQTSLKLNRFSYALYELKKCTDIKTATCAYYAYAHSWLQYGILLWGNSPDAIQLFRLQKRCLRILVNVDKMTSCKQHFIEQNILTLPSMYILQVTLFVKNNMSLFPQYSHASYLRPRNKVALPDTKMKMISSGPFAMAIKIFNKIPIKFQDISNIRKLKIELKTYLSKKSYYSIQEFLNDAETR